MIETVHEHQYWDATRNKQNELDVLLYVATSYHNFVAMGMFYLQTVYEVGVRSVGAQLEEVYRAFLLRGAWCCFSRIGMCVKMISGRLSSDGYRCCGLRPSLPI